MSTSAPSASPATKLLIRHIASSDPAAFQVTRLQDGKASMPGPVVSPVGFPVEGRPGSDLLQELQWYLETFLDYPFPPETEHAERVQKALRDWGEQAFRALFQDKSAGRMFDAATQQDYSNLHLQIASDDPRVLAWPWEALRDPELGYLGQTCQVQRRLDTPRDPQPLPGALPRECVNILLVVARPFERDVRFRSIARLLVELIEKEKLPATVELLRPPTFDRLRDHLRERPGFYHILHFDGHGAYSEEAPESSGFTLKGGFEGKLAFETEEGEPDLVPAEKLSALLKECAVPCVVLNACQSAMVKGESGDPFSSVAMALLRSGMRDVVAMAYSLYVSGAQQFLPAFYRRLFESGSVAVALRAGRQQMWQHDKRVCARGEFPLQDWLLPVLYQQDPLDFSFAKQARQAAHKSFLPEELQRARDPYGFVGRDSAILELERSMRRKPAGILIQGLGGVGKTTLARGFLQWLDQTGGFVYPPMWFSFQEIRSAEYVFNRMGEALFGGDFAALPAENPEEALQKKLERLAGAMREKRLLIVWDNFESASGIPGTATTANLPDSDRNLLGQFLGELRDCPTKVIITSRSEEGWLGPQRRFLLPLGGLDREERWEYCNLILHDLGKSVNREDKDQAELMNLLGGHPLAMRAILPHLEKMSAGQVLAALRLNLDSLKLEGDEDLRKLYATLAFVEQLLPDGLRPLLTPLGMHEGFVDADYLEGMAKQVDGDWPRAKIEALIKALISAGLLREIGQAIYEMHPLLTSFLRSGRLGNIPGESRDAWGRAFVDVMGTLAQQLGPLELHEQRVPFHLHSQNFHHALAEAERLKMPDHAAALAQSLAAFALHNRNFVDAQHLFEEVAERGKSLGNQTGEAVAYHQLGMIAEELRDFAAAENWYRKSLAIKEKQGNELGAAITYHQLGRIAEELRDFPAAENWYRKSLAITEKLGDERVAAKTYHQLGMIAQEQRDFAAAENWYRKSLTIEEKHGNEHGAASSYHQLGGIAQEQRDFAAAEIWYRKSLAIKEKLGDEHGAASTYHQLGVNAQERRDFAAAENWYRKSLAISEKQGNEHGAAGAYHQLGMIAKEQHDFAAAENWYRKSLTITEKLGNEHGAALTNHQLGIIAQEQRDFAAAEDWYRKSLAIKEKLGDEHGTAATYGQLGIIAALQNNFIASGEWLIKCIVTFRRTHDQHSAARNAKNFMILYKQAPPHDQARLKAMWQEAGLGELPDDSKS